MKIHIGLSVCCLILISSCLNTEQREKSKDGESNAQKPPMEKVSAITQITGFGIAKGKSREATEISAKKNANAAIAEQSQGSYFEYKSSSGKMLFSTDSGDVTLAGVRITSLETKESGKGWLTVAVASGQVEAMLPKNYNEVGVTVTAREKEPAALLFSLKKEALRRAAEIRSNGLTNISANGRIYLKTITLSLPDDGDILGAEAQFGVYFFDFKPNDTEK